jgi:bifunctional pyridoxal-dependent enzyme with beta-cystathionase and maltose regulon repressor activities
VTVASTYEHGEVTGVSFVLSTPAGDVGYSLPVEVHSVLKVLAEQDRAKLLDTRNRPAGGYGSGQHAARVAWRIAKDWLEAQLALIEARLATLDQVMLPYLVTDTGETLYARWLDQHADRLTAIGPSGD